MTLGSKSDYRVFQRTPVWDLVFALAVGDLGEVEELAIKYKKIIDTSESKTGCTLLTYAIRNNQLDAVKILLENRGYPNLNSNIDYKISRDFCLEKPMVIKSGFSPLKYAEYIDNLKVLVEAGGDIHIKNQYGGSLLLEVNVTHNRLTNILYL